ncbi:hypothetical protein B8W67_05250 [Mycolicibacillus koreensis]|uniref:Tape measure protein n=1 Tax=Mycolicibacillus koreensis TaxID=1069220 RepID=A0AA91SSC9_9MYCO|nr:hypothetical protein B8W67_05250 [Mycolicibacillus koreensis]
MIPETSQIAERLSAAFREVDPKAREAGKRWGREIQQGLGDIDVDLDTRQAQAKVDKLSSDVEDHDREMPVDADTSSARRSVDALDARIEGRTRTMRVDVDRTALSRLGGSLGSTGALKTNAYALAAASLPALTTGLTQVLGGVQQIAQAGLAMPGIFTAAASSIGTAVLGFQGVGDAITTMWDAAASGDPKDLEKAQAALQGLAPAAREVVGAVAELRPQLMGLKATAQQHIFAGLSDDLTHFANSVLPTVNTGLAKMADSWNATFSEMMRVGGLDSTKGMFARIFGDSAQAQQIVNGAIEPLTNALGKLSVAGADALPRIASGVVSLSQRFSSAIDQWSASGQLGKWINEGLTGLTELGNAFINVGRIINSLTTAAGGGKFLQWLETATDKLANFMALPSTQATMQNFFRQGADDLRQWGDLLKALLPVLQGVLDGAHRWGQVLLPILTDVANVLGQMPGLISAVVTAFLAWRTISGVNSLMSKLTGVGTALTGLPGKATFAANGISKALSLIVVPEIGKMLNDQLDQWLKDNHPTLDKLNHTGTPGNLGKSARDWVNEHAPWIGKHLPGYKAPQSDSDSSNALDWYKSMYPGLADDNATPSGLPAPNTKGITKSNPLPVTIADAPAIPQSVVTPSVSIPAIPAAASAVTVPATSAVRGPGMKAVPIPGMAGGPAVGAGDAIYFAKSRGDGRPYLFGGIGPYYDCSGYISGIYAAITGKNTHHRYFSTDTNFEALGFEPGLVPGGFNIGVHRGGPGGGHMAATLPNGVNVESGGVHDSTLYGGSAVGAANSEFELKYHLPKSLWLGGANNKRTVHSKNLIGTKSNPMYTLPAGAQAAMGGAGTAATAATAGSAKGMSQGEQLGRGIGKGLLQLFGFDGSVFGDPSQFGLTKTLGAISKVKVHVGNQTFGMFGPQGGAGGGISGLGGALNMISNIPKPFGDLAIGKQQEAPAPFMPALPASTSVNLPSPKAPGAPQQQAPQQRGGNQMTVNQTFNGVTPDEAMQRGREKMQGPARAMLNSMPR